jgi:hypothetical protein
MWCVFSVFLSLALFQKANAADPHCGTDPKIGAWSSLTKPTGVKLELVIHFDPKAVEIPKECVSSLLQISEKVKAGAKGKLIIRSSTSTDSSREIDLAIANERLEQIKNFLRNDRLALRAMQLELYSHPMFYNIEQPEEAPRLVEIYSSPVN